MLVFFPSPSSSNSHFLGAGTILDGLRRNKKMLVVVNNTLMDNHQTELFDAVVSEKYVWGCKKESDVLIKVF